MVLCRAIVFIAVLGAGFSSPAGAAFETLGQAARASAMGDAYMVQARDVNALWYNTAGLTGVKGHQVLADYARLFPDLDVGPDLNNWGFNYVQPLGPGNLGVGLAGLAAEFYHEVGFMLGYGYAVDKKLSLGAGLRLMRWSADGFRAASGLSDPDRSGVGASLDLGLRYAFWHYKESTLSFGFSGQNLNEPDVADGNVRGSEGVPRRLSFGLGYEDLFYVLEADVDVVDSDARLRVGGEYKFGGPYDLRLRAGASGLPGDGKAGEINAGLGFLVGQIMFNYGYNYSSEISTSGNQRFSVGYKF